MNSLIVYTVLMSVLAISLTVCRPPELCPPALGTTICDQVKSRFLERLRHETQAPSACPDRIVLKLLKQYKVHPGQRDRVIGVLAYLLQDGELNALSEEIKLELLGLHSSLSGYLETSLFVGVVVPNLDLPVTLRTALLWNIIKDTDGYDLTCALSVLEMGGRIKTREGLAAVRSYCDDDFAFFIVLRVIKGYYP